MVFLGDSNVAFGINSTLMEENFPEYNVVNFGSHGKLGLTLHLNDIKPYLKPNDVVIIIPTHQMFFSNISGFVETKPKYGSKNLLSVYLDVYPEGVKNFNLPQLICLPEIIQQRFPFKTSQIIQIIRSKVTGKKYLCIEEKTYTRSGFDSNGDYIAHLHEVDNNNNTIGNYLQGNLDNSTFDEINRFYEECSKKGIQVYFSYPPVAEDKYIFEIDTFDKLQNRMRDNLKVQTLGDIPDFVYPRSYFYEPPHHLNAIGREIRTDLIIKKMQDNKNGD